MNDIARAHTIDCPVSACARRAGERCRTADYIAGTWRDRDPHIERIEAGRAIAAAELAAEAAARAVLLELADGLPALAAAAVREHLRHGAEKHGATPSTSSADQSPLDHWYALLRHVGYVEGQGDRDLARPDPHSQALHLTAVVCRGLLALDAVLRELALASEAP